MAHDEPGDELLRRSFDPYLPAPPSAWGFSPTAGFGRDVRSHRRTRLGFWAAAGVVALAAFGIPGLWSMHRGTAGRGVSRLPQNLGAAMISSVNGWSESVRSRLYVTRNGGASWQKVPQIQDVHGVASAGSSTLWVLGAAQAAGTRFSVWYTSNMGRSWSRMTIALPWMPNLIAISAAPGGTAWVMDGRNTLHGRVSEAIVGLLAQPPHFKTVSVLTAKDLAIGTPAIGAATAVEVTPVTLRAGWGYPISPSKRGPSLYRIDHGRITGVQLALPAGMREPGAVPAVPSVIGAIKAGGSAEYLTAQYKQPGTGRAYSILYRNFQQGWQPVWHGALSQTIVDWTFISPRVGWILVEGHGALSLMRTTDGGRVFKTMALPTATVGSWNFSSRQDGWWSLYTHRVLERWTTTNGGRTWVQDP